MNWYVGERPIATGASCETDTDDLAQRLTTLRLGLDLLAVMGPGDVQAIDGQRLLHLLRETSARMAALIARLVAQPGMAPA